MITVKINAGIDNLSYAVKRCQCVFYLVLSMFGSLPVRLSAPQAPYIVNKVRNIGQKSFRALSSRSYVTTIGQVEIKRTLVIIFGLIFLAPCG